MQPYFKPVTTKTTNPVTHWLNKLKLGQYSENFTTNDYTNLDSLKSLDDAALTQIGINDMSHRSKILNEIKKSNDFQQLNHILLSNDLHELSHPLNQNDIDLDTLKQDIKLTEVESLCSSFNLNQSQTQQFKALVEIVHSQDTKTNDTPSNKMSMTLAIVGDSNVGKTSLIQRYVNDVFIETIHPTIGGDFFECQEILSDDTKMELSIWDTAGQERFQSICNVYYKNADAIIVCFDVSSDITFEHCENWTKQIEEYGRDNVVVIFAGCKADNHKTNRKSVDAKAKQIMERFGKLYCECSAKTGENVRNVFLTAAELVMKQQRIGNVEEVVDDGMVHLETRSNLKGYAQTSCITCF